MYRIIYKSRPSGSLSKDTFRDILFQSNQLNAEHSINGALIATKNGFLQFLEGEKEEILETYERIKKDERHQDVQLISEKEVSVAKFNAWRMRGFGLFGLNEELEQKLMVKYGDDDGAISLPENEEDAFALVADVDMLEPVY